MRRSQVDYSLSIVGSEREGKRTVFGAEVGNPKYFASLSLYRKAEGEECRM
jgi:hypothetical protein